MPRPRYCRNPTCPNAFTPPPNWCVRNGTYGTLAHGTVQRYRCRACGRGVSGQTESTHYYAKRRLDLAEIFSRLRGGSSMRDIGRELGHSRMAIANAALRLGRQAMAASIIMMRGIRFSGHLCFDGLVSAVASRDYPSQITTLGDSVHELVLAITHCVTERGGTRTRTQRERIEARRTIWRPPEGALTDSIRLLVNELSRFARNHRLTIDTDEHPIYKTVVDEDLALSWFRLAERLEVRTTPGSAPRTTMNPLFLVNYVDRMIRHRMKEHTRETVALAQNATMQMHRMWIFAWDHNTRQPIRVNGQDSRSRAEVAGLKPTILARLHREFYTRRISLRRLPVPESMRLAWCNELSTPPVRWAHEQKRFGPEIAEYALRDLAFAYPQAC